MAGGERRAEGRNSGFGLRSCSGSRPSTLDSRLARSAISLTEVLISLGILAVGLLGVASVFPVGSWYMQKATISDTGSALAQAVMNDIVARGTVDPKSWYAFVPVANGSFPAHSTFSSDSKLAGAPSALRGTFTRPFAQALKEALNQPTAATDPTLIDRQFGSAFVIDPLFIAAAVTPRGSPPALLQSGNNAVGYAFPAGAVPGAPKNSWPYYTATYWEPWRANGSERVWPIRRMTLQDSSGWAMGADMASHYFRGGDDLASDLPSRADRPARQNWDTMTSGSLVAPLARQRTGDYSWIVSVVPTTSAARNALANNPEGFSYDVSVVVFYKRILPSEPAAMTSGPTGVTAAATHERTFRASIVSTGLNGGELMLETAPYNLGNTGSPDDAFHKTPYENLKTGNWIMLCGPHPNSNVDMTSTPPKGDPKFVLKWYQVLSIETDKAWPNRRMVSVRGPQWPWSPVIGGIANAAHTNPELSNQLCVGICRGAVAVHTKTMRLEGNYGSGMALVKP